MKLLPPPAPPPAHYWTSTVSSFPTRSPASTCCGLCLQSVTLQGRRADGRKQVPPVSPFLQIGWDVESRPLTPICFGFVKAQGCCCPLEPPGWWPLGPEQHYWDDLMPGKFTRQRRGRKQRGGWGGWVGRDRKDNHRPRNLYKTNNIVVVLI